MAGVKFSDSQRKATLIGDIVASRRAASRTELHRTVAHALRATGDGFAAAAVPEFTAGDEFQGCYPTVGGAIDAAFTIKLALAPEIDVRFGIGWGDITMLDERIQDGPAWWAAREAIDWVAAAQRQPALARVRTAFRNAVADGPDANAVNAALLCRDQLLGSLDGRSVRLLQGLLRQQTKKELAAMEGISASAVSQRAARDGLDLLVLAAGCLRSLG